MYRRHGPFTRNLLQGESTGLVLFPAPRSPETTFGALSILADVKSLSAGTFTLTIWYSLIAGAGSPAPTSARQVKTLSGVTTTGLKSLSQGVFSLPGSDFPPPLYYEISRQTGGPAARAQIVVVFHIFAGQPGLKPQRVIKGLSLTLAPLEEQEFEVVPPEHQLYGNPTACVLLYITAAAGNIRFEWAWRPVAATAATVINTRLIAGAGLFEIQPNPAFYQQKSTKPRLTTLRAVETAGGSATATLDVYALGSKV